MVHPAVQGCAAGSCFLDSTEYNKSMNILITGHKGFIGSNLYKYFDELDGYNVYGMDIAETRIDDNNHKRNDIRNYNACLEKTRGMDVVLHQAAMNSVPRSFEIPDQVYSHNVQGFASLLRACEENKVKKFIYASSSAASVDPVSPYGLSKEMNEKHAQFSTIKTVGLRYANVYGPGQKDGNNKYAPVIPRFMQKKVVEVYGNGNQTRCFTYVKDVCHANKYFIETTFQQPHVIREVRGDYVSILELAILMGKDVRFIPSRRGDVLHPKIDPEKWFAHKYMDIKDGLKLMGVI